ncbi:MAG: protein-methionine-sulfoxide reductase catalytic subunit MsrP [Gammaproteobacteria bacterium]|nr:protein-methionine-sulfoxide reductase catalytic subunit MsrP [Gammaproteobacteria bacterium]MDH3766886.1 protein-methionine-sulfoxide reductase catalytic subunit MsrP [Gammaproteobacteria bacterium]
MRYDSTPRILSSEITDETDYLNRREFLRLAGIAAAGAVASSACQADVSGATTSDGLSRGTDLGKLEKSVLSIDDKPNSFEDITTYNNFYEFGTDKSDPHRNAKDFVTEPWTLTVAGECSKPGTYDFDELMRGSTIEERVYRLRCVEAWSMIVPWAGISMATLLKRFEPNSRANFVKYTTLYDPDQMPTQRRRILDWPYVEGLTIAEAMNPLTIMVVGLYGKVLPNQNGAPMRLMVPWKYGFKSIKSIVRIEFTEKQPLNTWQISAPHEYGFYANVNPEVDHPRWSQARERRIGTGLFAEKIPTLMFNGYAEHVAHLYDGLDLAKNF